MPIEYFTALNTEYRRFMKAQKKQEIVNNILDFVLSAAMGFTTTTMVIIGIIANISEI